MRFSRQSSRAFAVVEVLLIVVILGLGGSLVRTKFFSGDAKRATASTKATAQLVAATDAPAAAAAASVTKIAEANAAAPASPARDFIGREAPLALTLLPAPDPAALIEAERRRAAVMEGRLDEARRLYEGAAKESAELRRERDAAIAQRRAVDLQLEQAAAAEQARTMQAIGAGSLALVFAVGWIWLKVRSISLPTAGQMMAELRAGENPVAVFDRHLRKDQHATVNRHAKLATELKDS